MPGIGVISNRNARLNRLNPELKDQLAFIIGSDGEVASTGSLGDVSDVVRFFKDVDIDILAISGGDGTAHRTLDIVLQVYGSENNGNNIPPILLLPTGTQNMVPRSFGIDGNGTSTLMLAMARYRHNVPMQCIKRNTLMVNGHAGFLFAMGSGVRFLQSYYDNGETTPLGAAKLFSRLVADAMTGGKYSKAILKPIKMQRLDHGTWQDFSGIHTFFASFVERLPIHFILFPRAGEQKDHFVLLGTNEKPHKIAPHIPFVLAGKITGPDVIKRSLENHLHLRFEEPEKYTLDGDIYGPVEELQISPGPELQFVVPTMEINSRNDKVRTSQIGPWEMRYLV